MTQSKQTVMVSLYSSRQLPLRLNLKKQVVCSIFRRYLAVDTGHIARRVAPLKLCIAIPTLGGAHVHRAMPVHIRISSV